jgi:hypothetical protein
MTHPAPQELALPCDPAENIIAWLTDQRTAEYFGNSWKLKAGVLAAVITKSNLAEVARQHGLTRAAASKQARRAKAIFGDMATLS